MHFLLQRAEDPEATSLAKPSQLPQAITRHCTESSTVSLTQRNHAALDASGVPNLPPNSSLVESPTLA